MGRRGPNPYVGLNYIPDNPKMAEPPAFVLQRIYDFDNMLVLFPSRHIPYAYVIARRKQRTAGLQDKALLDTIDQPDTKMVMAYDCVPVTLLYQIGTTWNIDPVLAKLKARDIWEAGGAEKFATKMDEADKAREDAIKKANRTDMYERSGDAWRSYQARTGQRVAYRGGGARTERRKVTSSSSGSTAGSGVIASRD